MMTPALYHVALFLSLMYAVFSLPSPIETNAADALRVAVNALDERTYPYFPPEPPSCPKCEAEYGSIQNCAEAAPVLANFSMVIFNPSAFIDVIQCACTETFQAVFPQCADCFIKTNQSQVLEYNTEALPDVLEGVRRVCAMASVLLGNASGTNGEAASTPTPDPNGVPDFRVPFFTLAFAVMISIGVGY